MLITGGAGFVGSNLALALAARHEDWDLLALDNLRRRGAELNLPRLREAGVQFVHGDVRQPGDLDTLGPIDALIECSAEPSALAGFDGSTGYLVHSNLLGAYNCLELCHRERAQLIFLSTSRVYPIAALEALRVTETASRFELDAEQPLPGASAAGIAEDFPLSGARTLYGTTKLSAELLIAEYAASLGLSAVVNRCGVIAGPWQMGKVDQGVFTYWVLAHHLGRPLAYIGYGGGGKQVRDLLHASDLTELIDEQLCAPDHWEGLTVNVGGGRDCSLSLREATDLCRELTGNEVEVRPELVTRPGDVPVYLSDCGSLFAHSAWRPTRTPRDILADILDWIRGHEKVLTTALG